MQVILNPVTEEYSYLTPSGLRTIGKAEEDERLKRAIASLTIALIALALALDEGRITIVGFQLETIAIVKQIHLYQAALGAGGWHRIDDEARRIVQEEVARQIDGMSPDGKRYGLRTLTSLIVAGGISLAMLQARLGHYAVAGKISYWASFQRVNRGVLAQRVLGLSDRHCQCCVDEANREPVPIEEIKPIGTCTCLGNCKCSIEIVLGDRLIPLEENELPVEE